MVLLCTYIVCHKWMKNAGASTNNRLIMLIQFDINLNKNSSLIRFWFARYNLQYMYINVRGIWCARRPCHSIPNVGLRNSKLYAHTRVCTKKVLVLHRVWPFCCCGFYFILLAFAHHIVVEYMMDSERWVIAKKFNVAQDIRRLQSTVYTNRRAYIMMTYILLLYTSRHSSIRPTIINIIYKIKVKKKM